jgi:predicted small lipoprotein YifL
MKKYLIIMLVLSMITVVLSACGGKGPLPPSDTTSPSISSISPTNGAQNVSVNSSITITFSEAMDASTINEKTITLSMGTGNVPGSVACSETTAVFKPVSSLSPETIYTVTVVGGITAGAGN